MGVRLVKLRVIIIGRAGEIDDVADMIAEQRLAAVAAGQMLEHLVGDIALKFAVLHAAGIADDMKRELAVVADRLGDLGKLVGVGQVVVVGRQSQRARQRLKAGVAMADGMQRAYAGMRLRMLGRRFGPRLARAQVILRRETV